jgi:hypothetical protein
MGREQNGVIQHLEARRSLGLVAAEKTEEL